MVRNGTQVLVSRIDPLQEVPLRASVVSSGGTQLRLAFPEMVDLGEVQWRSVRQSTLIGDHTHDIS
jgi:hypothetical protein